MEPKIQSSFIPKKPITSGKVASRHKVQTGAFYFLSLLVLLGSISVAGVLFFYTEFLDRSIESKGIELQEARASFAPAKIQELERLSMRINTAQDLLDEHRAPTLLFDLLEELTLKTVQFKNLQYSILPDGRSSISMTGVARSFASVALQSDAFNDEKSIQEPIFSGLNVNENGYALFTFNAFVGGQALSYKKYVEKYIATSLPDLPEEASDDEESVIDESQSDSAGNPTSSTEQSGTIPIE